MNGALNAHHVAELLVVKTLHAILQFADHRACGNLARSGAQDIGHEIADSGCQAVKQRKTRGLGNVRHIKLAPQGIKPEQALGHDESRRNFGEADAFFLGARENVEEFHW